MGSETGFNAGLIAELIMLIHHILFNLGFLRNKVLSGQLYGE